MFFVSFVVHTPFNSRSFAVENKSRHKSGILSLDVFKSHMGRENLAEPVRQENAPNASALLMFPSSKLPTIQQATELLVAEAMKRSDRNQSIAAGMLGISQQALSKRLKKKKQEQADK
ncbi:MAG: hypothetical protein B6245_12195 [Desulfobacteraceae bacterium 4572_88]|nr:MAG: hypothetical protein B6245_12195 [Desulfobacteraceae bacterium 4572_88]RLC09133.1 MAG: hypothetical protein DRI57_22700 [Deltaproteobacteria bacterium]